jgi:UDPglucose 6-dehydrogenase
MRLTMVGTGYVGLVSGTCFAEFGHDVTCVDLDAGKVERLTRGEIPIYEPGLDALVARGVSAGLLHFTTDLAAAVATADVVFIAVGTPSRRGDGHADLRYVEAAAADVARAMKGYTVIVNKSTVPVGTGRRVRSLIAELRPDAEFDVVSNPEFLREGSAIEDFLRPDRVVLGAESDRAREAMRALYRPLSLRDVPMVVTSIETAELTKYAANAFLATKITFINEIADLCEKLGADVQDVARGMGLDGRIGNKFLHAGPGYGGSCFPKDTLALVRTGQEAGQPMRIVETVVQLNDTRKGLMASRVIAACGGSVRGKTIGVLGVAFKPETDDMRDAPSLSIIPALQDAGATVRAHDPAAMHEAAKQLANVEWCDDPYAVSEGASAVVLITEWNAYRALDLERLGGPMVQRAMVDLRNVYRSGEAQAAGFSYRGIGRGSIANLRRATDVTAS